MRNGCPYAGPQSLRSRRANFTEVKSDIDFCWRFEGHWCSAGPILSAGEGAAAAAEEEEGVEAEVEEVHWQKCCSDESRCQGSLAQLPDRQFPCNAFFPLGQPTSHRRPGGLDFSTPAVCTLRLPCPSSFFLLCDLEPSFACVRWVGGWVKK